MADTPHGKNHHVNVCSFPGCAKTFSRPNRLIVHIRSHTGEKPFKCEIRGCDREYARLSHLSRHQENAHCDPDDSASGDIVCPHDGCKMTFTLPQNLAKHIKRKHEATVYKCEVEGCGKTFKKRQHQKVHEFEHTGINPFVCSHPGCGMRFRFPSRLHRHEKVHLGYSCDVPECDAHFPKWTQLRKHKAEDHVTEHKCDECGKKFSQKQWLKQHQKVHSEERDLFICPRENCGRNYLDQRNLLAHIRSYHDGQKFMCERSGCQRKFVSEQKLKEHQKLHDSCKPPPKKKPKKTQTTTQKNKLFKVKEDTEVLETDKLKLSDVSLHSVNNVTMATQQTTCNINDHPCEMNTQSMDDKVSNCDIIYKLNTLPQNLQPNLNVGVNLSFAVSDVDSSVTNILPVHSCSHATDTNQQTSMPTITMTTCP